MNIQNDAGGIINMWLMCEYIGASLCYKISSWACSNLKDVLKPIPRHEGTCRYLNKWKVYWVLDVVANGNSVLLRGEKNHMYNRTFNANAKLINEKSKVALF